MKANVSSKKKREKEKKKNKNKKKRKRKRRKIATLYLETRTRSEGYMEKAFKAWCPKLTGWELPNLVLATWVDGGVEQVVGAGVLKSFEVRGET